MSLEFCPSPNATPGDETARERPLTPDDDPFEMAEPCGEKHSAGRKVIAGFIALILLAISVLAASFSLFKGPPAPELTQPLPPAIPSQGAIR